MREMLLAAAAVLAAPAIAQDSGALGVQGVSDAEAAALRAVIETQTRELIAGDHAAYAASFAETAVLMPLDHPRVVGREAIVVYIGANFPAGTTVRYADWDVAARDDLAVISNNATVSVGGSDAPPETIDQIVVLRRDGGTWRVQTAIWAIP